MKKIALSLLTCLYLMLSTGFSMELHFCMGHLQGFDFFCEKNEKCPRCGMSEKNNGCCKDELKFYKLEDNFKHNGNIAHLADEKSYTDNTAIVLQPIAFQSIPVFFDFQSKDNVDITGPPVYIQNRVLRL